MYLGKTHVNENQQQGPSTIDHLNKIENKITMKDLQDIIMGKTMCSVDFFIFANLNRDQQ